MRFSPPLPVDDRDADILRRWVESDEAEPAVTRRARIVLMSADGMGPVAIAERLGCSKQTVITWRERFRATGLSGLRDAPRSGRPATVDEVAVVERTLAGPPPSAKARRWSTRLLAAEAGDSNVAVSNVWRAWGIWPAERGGLRYATRPVLEARVTGVHAVLVEPSLQFVALAVDSATSAPALPGSALPGSALAGSALAGSALAGSALAGRPSPGPAPPGPRPALGTRFSAVAAEAAWTDPLDVGVLAGGLAGATATGPLVLLADREPDGYWRAWCAARPEVGVHVATAEGAWPRLAHVACAAAAGTAAGAAAMADLACALDGHRSGSAFAWCRAHGMAPTAPG